VTIQTPVTETPAATTAQTPPVTEAKPDGQAAAAATTEAKPVEGAPAAAANKEAGKADDGKLLATEKKPDDKPAEGENKEAAKAHEAKKAPEKYELKAKEGSALAADRLKAIEAEAKEKGLSNEEAQALLDREENAVAGHVEREQAAYKERQAQWKETVSTDKEMGGDNQARFVESAHRVIARFASPELKEILNNTELGNHPELVRLLGRVGQAIGEDRLVVPSAQAGAVKKSPEEKFYDNTK
jgi:hypothetical protein